MTTPVRTGPARAVEAAESWPISPKPWGQYWVCASDCYPISGEVLPLPMLVRVTPGVLGTGADCDPGTSDLYQTKQGRVPVPLDFEVVAWGKKVDHYMVDMLIRKDANGKEIHHFHDVWTRYSRVGGKVITEFDAAGFVDFRRRCLKLIGGHVHPSIEAAAMAQARADADACRQTGTPHGEREAAKVEANLEKPKPTEGAKKS